MKNLVYTIIIFIGFYITGCTTPDMPTYKINKTDNIGYIIKTNSHMIHTNIGLTVFSNFEKKYPKLVTKQDIQHLLKQNINAKLINLKSYKYDDLNNLIIQKDNKWVISNKKLYNELIKKYHLKAIIIVTEEDSGIYVYPSFLSTSSSGLLSRSVLGVENYYAISGFYFKLHILQPNGSINIYEDTTHGKIIYASLNDDFQKQSGFIKPADIQHLTKKEQQSIKKTILDLTRHNIKLINKYLVHNH